MSLPQGRWSLGKEAGQVILKSNLVSKMIIFCEAVKYDHSLSHKYPRSIMKSGFHPFTFSLVHKRHNSGELPPAARRSASLSWRVCCLWSLWTTKHQHGDQLGAIRRESGMAWLQPAQTCTGSRLSICRPWSSWDQRMISICSLYPPGLSKMDGGENPAGGIWVRWSPEGSLRPNSMNSMFFLISEKR